MIPFSKPWKKVLLQREPNDLPKKLFHFSVKKQSPSTHVKSDHYRPVSETPSGWRFASGPIVVGDGMLAGVSFSFLSEWRW